MPAGTDYMSVQSWMAIGKETTRGTAASTLVGVPIDPNPSLTPQLKWIDDKSLRGSPVELYDKVAGNRSDDYEPKGMVYLDTIGHLLMGLLGGTDTVTGTGPYVHTLGLLNSASTGSQPPSYTLQDFDGPSTRQATGAQLDSLSFSVSAEGAATWTAKWIGNPYTTVAGTVPSYSIERAIPGWGCTVTVGGVASSVHSQIDIEAKRSTAPEFTLGTGPGPYRVFAGALAVTGKCTVVLEASDPTITNALAQNQTSLAVQIGAQSGTESLLLHMNAAQFHDPKVNRGKSYVEVDAAFDAISNTTDASTGYSPLKATLTNQQSTAY